MTASHLAAGTCILTFAVALIAGIADIIGTRRRHRKDRDADT